MSTKAQVLIQLLEKIPDTNKLQRLLEPENLLYLLQQYGYQKEDLQQRLKNGMLPGELLLELLEQEPDSEYLLVMLSNTMDTKVEKRVVIDQMMSQMKKDADSPSLNPAPVPSDNAFPKAKVAPLANLSSHASMSDEGSSIFQQPPMVAALVIVAVTSITPALIYTDVFSGKSVSSSPVIVLIVALIGGAVAGALFSRAIPTPYWKGILIGIVLNVGVLLATIVYIQARTELFKIELVIPLGLGSLPALGLYYLLARRT
jgi:hypothetical protein